MQQLRIPAVYMRGGTSKGLFFCGDVLPDDPTARDRILLRALGSPDPFRRQVDGLGGATSSTSKAVIVSPSSREDSDVDYLFAQVAIDRPVVDYAGNCGNLTSAVGPFAIEEGFVRATGDVTLVRIWQVNTGKRILAHVPTRDGLPVVEGDYHIDGVPNPGAEIRLEFLDPGGSVSGRLLPTGNVVDRLQVPGLGELEITLVDAANPAVFVDAAELGLTGTELPETVDGNPELLRLLEAIRAHAAVRMGVAESPEEATRTRPATPRVAFVAAARSYRTSKGAQVEAGAIDLVARMMSMGRLHHAYPITGAIATAIAAVLPGSVVHRVAGTARGGGREVRIGHTAGVVRVGAEVEQREGLWVARKAVVGRTARRLMEGFVRVPASVLSRDPLPAPAAAPPG